MKDIIIPSLAQLLVQSPVLLVYVAGLILALVFWQRCPTSCLLVLLATALLLLVSVAYPFVIQYFIKARTEMGWTHEKLGWVTSAAALTTSCCRAVAMGLLFAAVFLHRGVSKPAG